MKSPKSKRLISLVLSVLMTLNLFSWNVSAAYDPASASEILLGDTFVTDDAEDTPEPSLSENQMEAYASLSEYDRLEGLIGFEEAGISLTSDELVPVIVEFVHRPAQVELALAQAAGGLTPFSASHEILAALAASDRLIFEEGLSQLFSSQPNMRSFSVTPPFEITFEYNLTLNGTAMWLPASKIPELLDISSVYAVYYDELVPMDDDTVNGNNGEEAYANALNALSLAALNVPAMHEKGIKGQGVLVGVIDSGVDYNHPDLIDTFQSWATLEEVPQQWQSRVHWRDDTQRYYYYGVNNYDNTYASSTHPYPNLPKHGVYDPMEITWQEWKVSGYAELSGSNVFYGSHGTHVCGIVAARGVFAPNNVVGVAPEAKLALYRYGGPYNSGPSAALLAGIENAVEDGCDVVNYSVGTSGTSGVYTAQGLAANLAALTYDIVFCKSTGNNGPAASSLSGPGGAAMLLVVGNATFAGSHATEFTVGGSPFNAWLKYTDGTTEYHNSQPYDFYILPLKIGSGASSSDGFDDISSGAAGAWTPEAIAAAQGKVVVISRGHTFLTSMELAKSHGAAGIMLINSSTGNPDVFYFSGTDTSYFPFFTIDYTDGLAFAEALRKNDMKAVLSNYEQSDHNFLYYSSSRGPSMETFDIKPEIIAPGASVWSTVPPGSNWGSGHTTPLDEDYAKYGYATKTGTSMATPYVAGLSALILSVDRANNNGIRTMSSPEVKARLSNSGSLDYLTPLVKHGVNEVGAGAPNIAKALEATTYITVTKPDVPIRNGVVGSTNYVRVSGEVTSFSFGIGSVGTSLNKTLTATVHNKANIAKSFALSVQWNDGGQNVKEHGPVSLAFNTSIVNVEPNSVSQFTATISGFEHLANKDAGSYEGYVVLTNLNDSSEHYWLPFGINIGEVPEWYAYGNQTGEYIVREATELAQLASIVNGTFVGIDMDSFENKTVRLGADIDLSDYANWTPIGTGATNAFRGVFDGQNHKVHNLRTTGTSSYRALIGFAINAVIKNVTIESGEIRGAGYSSGIVGIIRAGESNDGPAGETRIENCHNKANIVSSGDYVGGIVGSLYVYRNSATTVIGCSNEGAISGAGSIGGIIGSNTNNSGGSAFFADCSNKGDISGSGNSIGGINGAHTDNESCVTTISNCTNTGSVRGTGASSANIGGLIGNNVENTSDVRNNGGLESISDCSNTGAVRGINYVGGLIGRNAVYSDWVQTMTDCHNEGSVLSTLTNSTTYAGGLIGWLSNSNGLANIKVYLTDCHNSGNVTTSSDIARTGGIVGYGHLSTASSEITLSGLKNIGTVTAQGSVGATSTSGNVLSYSGGIAGYLAYGMATDCANYGDIIDSCNLYGSGSYTARNVGGGIIGYALNSSVLRCANLGNISVSASTSNYICAAGIVGYIGTSGTIANSYNTGSVRGQVTETPPVGSVNVYVGGLAGWLATNTADIKVLNSINLGDLHASPGTPGALIGANASSVERINNYRFSDVKLNGTVSIVNTPSGSNNGGTLSSTELLTRQTYETKLGWTFGETGWFWNDIDPFPAATKVALSFPGLSDISVGYYRNGWNYVSGSFDTSMGFLLDAGVYTLQMRKDGMWYTLTDAEILGGQNNMFDIPVKAITVTGLSSDCLLGVIQNDWVYREDTFATNSEPSFNVFDNGTYKLSLRGPGYHQVTIEDIKAGDAVDLSSFFYQITVPEGITNVWMSSADWFVRDATAGNVLTLLKTGQAAKLRYEQNGTTYDVDFVLDGSNPFPSRTQVTLNFPGVSGITIGYYKTSWNYLPGTFSDTASFELDESGTYTLQVRKDGMWINLSNAVIKKAENNIFDISVKAITITGLSTDCLLGVIQNDWIYREGTFAANTEPSFNVFDNGIYTLSLRNSGYSRFDIKNIKAGDTVDLSEYLYQVTVPEGITNVWMSSADWIVRGATADDTLTLLKTGKTAKLRYEQNGTTYNADFILDGSNPFSEAR